MIKRIGRQAYQLLLALLLIGAIFASFQSSATFAQIVPEQPALDGGGSGAGGGGGGGVTCPDTTICGNFGCHPKSIADPTMVCSRYLLDGAPPGSSCPSPVNCR
jgi:hypothetical protein